MKMTSTVAKPTGKKCLSLGLAFCLLVVHSAQADYDFWAGVPGTSTTTNWTDAANWTGAVQTWYNEVEFTGKGANANTDFSVNNVLDGTTGVAQMPIWELDYVPTNGNYTTLIKPGVTLTLGAGWGSLFVGADALNNANPAPANAVETITITGAGGAMSVGGNIYVGQGSTTPGDAHNVTLDLSGLDNFTNSGSQILVASGGFQRANGTLYLAKTNQITLGNDFEICNQSYSNSQPCAVYLGQTNRITLGSGNLIVGGSGTTAVGAWMKFNPAFLGGASPPAASFAGSGGSGRIANFWICNVSNVPQVSGYGLCDFSGGNVTMYVSTMQLGQAGNAGANANGVLTLDDGIIDVNDAIIGNQEVDGGGAGIGTVNLNTNSILGTNATLQVNSTLTLAAVTGALTPGTAGTINVNGGTLAANTIVNGAGNGAINLSNGTLTLTHIAGTPLSPISNLAATNSTLNLTIVPGSNSIVAVNLKTGGTSNLINITSAPPFGSYPAQVTLIRYSGGVIGGAGYNFRLGSLPLLYSGYLSNNTANGSVDLVLTSGSGTLTWVGNVNGNWDTTTANWLAGGSTTYADGEFVQFLDGASRSLVNLTTALSPAGVTVSNSTPNYTFGGSGHLSGSANLLKAGTGTLVVDNTGNNDFSGGVTIGGGTLQVGNNDGGGNLPPGSVVDNGNLAFARTDNITIGNDISGTGSVAQAGSGGTLLLSGVNSFLGNVVVTNGSKLQAGNVSALGSGSGSLIIANGSTFDANGYASPKSIIVSGSGVGGNGAIVDSSANAVYDLVTNITLAGNTTFGYPTRWDLAHSLSSGGNAYTLTLAGNGNYFEWRNLAVDSALGDINLQSGQFGVVGTTTFGDPAHTLTLAAGASVVFYGGPYSRMNKAVDFQSGAVIDNYGGDNIMSGTMTLEPGFCQFNISAGTSLTISNTLNGSGVLYQNGGTGPVILSGNSPSFSGGVSLYTGKTILNGTIGSGITSQFDTIVAGNGNAGGLVDVSGALLPGDVGIAGTFHAQGGLILESGAVVTNDLDSMIAGNNDLIQVTGDLTVSGNNIYINPVAGQLADGTYTLFTYTGTLSGSFGSAATTLPTAYTLVLTNVTTTSPKKIQLIVTGTITPSLLVWNNASGNGQWDTSSSANWSNVTTHASSAQFNSLDAVVFDNSITSAGVPTTNVVVPSGQIIIPTAITNNSTVSYTISGLGKISGAGSLVKSGSGTLGLGVSGGFTGPVLINGGTVQTLSNNTLAAVASITVTNGGTLDFDGSYLTNNSVTVSGAGAGGRGALYNSGGPVYGNLLNIKLAGNATFGASNRWDLATGSQITGAHSLTIDWLTGSGYGEWNSVNVGSDVTGITLTNGNIGMKYMDTAFQNPGTVITVSTNCQLTFWNGGYNGSIHILNGGLAYLWTAPAPFNGSNIILEQGAQWQSFYNTDAEPINSAITLNGVAHIVVGNHDMIYTNLISGPGGFVFDYYGNQMVLSASNTYNGPTIIGSSGNNPQVALTNNGSISHSSLIFFGGADSSVVHVDASGRSDHTLTLAGGQTLAGIGAINGNLTVSPGAILSPAGTNTTIGITTGANATGTISASSNITLNGTTIMKLNGSGVNDQVQSATSIAFGGTLNLLNISGSLLANGDSFQIFSAPGYSGSFANITPAAPGTGLAWDLSQLNSGVVSVVVAGGAGPVINSPEIIGGNLILSGTGGTNNGTYHVLTTTNLAAPLASWLVLTNGMFDASGNFSSTNAVGRNQQQFFIIKQP